MSRKGTLTLNKPDLFSPSVVRKYVEGSYVASVNFEQLASSNIESTASFRYDSPGSGIRSTQQVNVDYSNFANHTFFNSAEVNVNVAFDKIINNFPFDGTKKEVESFFDGLSGFEKYVYDQFPKNRGFLFFSGTQAGEVSSGGTVVSVNDFAGSKYPTLSKNRTGNNIIDPGDKSISFEMHLYLPSTSNDNQTVLQKISGSNNGISLFVSNSSNTSNANLVFVASSGSNTFQVDAPVLKGRFNHVCAVFNRKIGINRLQLYVNEKLLGESSSSQEFGSIDFRISPLTIGSGSVHNTTSSLSFVPRQTLSGAVDEFRVFHDVRTVSQQEKYGRKSIYPDSSLVLYYKFNEPSGTLGTLSTDSINRIVLDSSGNSLHSEVSNGGFSFGLRNTSSIDVPMTNEKLSLSPVLFPNYHELVVLNDNLLTTASFYDSKNPNLITKLFPKHYFEEGQVFEGLSEEEGTIGDSYSGTDMPGSGELGASQVFASLLFVYARFFDEMKVILDSFGKTLTVGYDPNNTISDNFLILLGDWHGIKLPGLFTDANIEQFIDAENIKEQIGTSALPLRTIQNTLLRRVLASARDILKSKGTLYSIKSFIRAIGIDPDNTFKIREFGGPSKKELSSLRHQKTEVSTLLNLSASNCFITSSFLSGSKAEIGFPQSMGTHVNFTSFTPHGVSNNINDGQWTSGSWSYEAIYKFPIGQVITNATQSLVRICTTGSATTSANGSVLFNAVAISSSNPFVRLYGRPGNAQTLAQAPAFYLETNANIFDGNKWHVSFGRERNDQASSAKDGLYFLRCERRTPGLERKLYLTQSYFTEASTQLSNSLQYITNGGIDENVSGSFLWIGSQSLNVGSSTATFRHLNNTTTPDESRHVIFDGKVGHIRFWSKFLTEDELEEHAANFKSLGVLDPTKNFNFVKNKTGSFERLRLDTSTDQPITKSDASGRITLVDFSQNNSTFFGSGFEANKRIIDVEFFDLEQLSTELDEFGTNNKVRVRSFNNPENYPDEPYAAVAPLYEIPRSEQPVDDNRFSIEYSVIDSLNQDIINMFASLDFFNDALGKPENMYADNYQILEDLRENVYFKRLEAGKKVNIHAFLDFFKWISSTIDSFIGQLLPKNVSFKGVNYTIESSLLERAKFDYSAQADIYLGEQIRLNKGTIFLQQASSILKKF